MICKRCNRTAMRNWSGHCPPCWKVVKALRLEAEALRLEAEAKFDIEDPEYWVR